jgi:L,D-transpeptidase catalytic domain
VRTTTPPHLRQPAPSKPRRSGAVLGVAVVLIGVAVLVYLGGRLLTQVSLTTDSTALARVDIKPLGGRLVSASAVDSRGRRVPLANAGGHLTPMTKVRPGQAITVDVVVHRPALVGWALGSTEHRRLTVVAPRATVATRWVSVKPGGPLFVGFDRPVSRVVYGVGPARHNRTLSTAVDELRVEHHGASGTVKVAIAARAWERVGTPTPVTWFPTAHETVAVSDPTPGRIAPSDVIHLTFSKPVSQAIGSAEPVLTPAIHGQWHQLSSHTLEFHPSGDGLALGTSVTVTLPQTVAVVGAGGRLRRTRELTYTVPAGSMLRLQQILAEKGYLPLNWSPSAKDAAHTKAAQAQAAVDPPSGHFTWRYHHTPHELKALWTTGQLNEITRGALMAYQNSRGLAVDAVAGPGTWKSLLADAASGEGQSPTKGYNYVFVHKRTPQRLRLWHSGHVLVSSPGNTGVPAAPTQLGTFPVFEHLASTTMSGTNPDGTKYKDPGIKWVSYFNGGDALHAFPRASFGTPQSLGCVELPLAAAAKIWPYTPIGTLVTIEN